MLAEFTLKNNRSFKEKHTLSLISTKNKELSGLNTFEANERLSFLKTAVIYGANASGKSNLFYGLMFFLRFAVTSGPRKQIGDVIEAEPFILSKQTESEPSSFEIVFYLHEEGASGMNGGGEWTRYRYGFSVSKEKVEYEYLFAINKVREVTLFTRKNQDIEYTPYFKEGARGKPSVRENCTFLSVCAQNNGETAVKLISYFRKIIVLSGLNDQYLMGREKADMGPADMSPLENPAYQKEIIDFLKCADIQITKLKTERIPVSTCDVPENRILFGHTFYDNETPVGEKFLSEINESAGARKLFSYSGAVLMALKNGAPLFIDEFDSLLHPLIIESSIKLFNSPIHNPNNAQLVISCHAVNIMTNKILRRDQIWFCEKDQYGATDLYSLVEYKEPVRNDAAFNKNYLQGKYGAVPAILADQLKG
ncbi:transporter [Spirochaetia bacterium]|nr:transporter [Spirochaetia bacterium]